MTEYELNTLDTGYGEPVVLLHGILGSTRYWSAIVEKLSQDHRAVAVDLLGYGESPKPTDSTYDFDAQIGSIRRTLADSGVDGPYRLVGHSMGALIALRLAAEYPSEVRSLTLFGMPIYESKEKAREQIVESGIVPKYMVYGHVARFICSAMCTFRPMIGKLVPMYRKDLPKDVVKDSVKHTWYSYSRSMQNIIEGQNVVKDLGRLSVPTTLVYGKSDELVRFNDVKSLQSLSENIQVVIKEGTHHFPIEHPDLAIPYITES